MIRRLALAVLMIVVLATAVACGSKEPAATPEPTPGEATGLDGAAIMQEKCTVCHDLTRVQNAEYDAVGWADVIDRMVEKGADVSTDEAAALAEYLSLQ